MPLYGVIDLGSNSVRLVVYRVREDACAPFTKRSFKSLINEKKIVGLSAYVEDGLFTDAGVARAAEVLDDHLRHARNIGCTDVRIFATAVLRNCENSAEATAALSKAVEAPIDVLSARDEAHLGFVGATCDRVIERGTLIDIGGGSTELTAIAGGVDTRGVSVPQGSVSSYAQFVDRILPTPDEMHAIEDAFREKLCALGEGGGTLGSSAALGVGANASTSAASASSAAALAPFRSTRLYGIGGATRAALKTYNAAFGVNPAAPKSLNLHQLDALLTLLARDPHTFSHTAVRAVPERLHTLVPGCLIAITLMRELGAQTLEICRYGVREGYLIKRILEA